MKPTECPKLGTESWPWQGGLLQGGGFCFALDSGIREDPGDKRLSLQTGNRGLGGGVLGGPCGSCLVSAHPWL